MATLKFHLDENLSSALASGLRRRGLDVTTTPEQDLMAASDEQQLAYAFAETRVLVTNDQDLLKLHAKGLEHAGVVYITDQSTPIGAIINQLVVMWRLLDSQEMFGQVQYL